MPALRWQPIASLLLSVYGLGASIYLTITHFEPKALACVQSTPPSTARRSPRARSRRSSASRSPCSGLVFFVPMLALCLPVAWRSAQRWVHLARLVLSVTGVGMIIYLISAELFVIKAICLWCSSVHVATLLLFIIIATASPVVLAPGYGEVGTGAGGRRAVLSRAPDLRWLTVRRVGRPAWPGERSWSSSSGWSASSPTP